MQINHNLAKKQLAFLKGLLTFQTFHDVKLVGVPKDIRLNKILHGSYENVRLQLQNLNEKGAGIYVTINETDGLGRAKANIKRIRAVATDHDGDLPPPFPIAPTFSIISKHGPQHWWMVEGFSPQDFEGVQKRLIKDYRSDPKVCDQPRVLRLAGYYHLKDPQKPFMIQFQEGSGRIYKANEILSHFPPITEKISGVNPSLKQSKITSKITTYSFMQRRLAELKPVFAHCEAFVNIKLKVKKGDVLSHEEGFALFHLCLQFEGGPQWFISRVPGWGKTNSDLRQLQHSIDKKYGPWSCAMLQAKNVCRFENKCHCMPIYKKGTIISQPNPIRFAEKRTVPSSEKLNDILNHIKQGENNE